MKRFLIVLMLAGCSKPVPTVATPTPTPTVMEMSQAYKDYPSTVLFTEEWKSRPVEDGRYTKGHRLRCGRCVDEGTPSNVYPGDCSRTLVWSMGHYDKEGAWHERGEYNTSTCQYVCSNSHWFEVTR